MSGGTLFRVVLTVILGISFSVAIASQNLGHQISGAIIFAGLAITLAIDMAATEIIKILKK